MTQNSFDADVLIIGGGPAGATAALSLARAGARALILEKHRLSRFHVGESCLPKGLELIDETEFHVVQFVAAVRPEWKRDLEQARVTFLDYVPTHAFLTRFDSAGLASRNKPCHCKG